MINFLAETKSKMKEIGKTEEDIRFIGILNGGNYCTWKEFCIMADREYYNSFGINYVEEDLVIIFNDGSRLHRYEYDGSEEWIEISAIDRYKCLSKMDTLFIERRFNLLKDVLNLK